MRRAALRSIRAAPLVLLLLAGGRDSDAADALSLQEVILRTKPATVLVVAEVTAEVTVDCGMGERRVTPTPFRETGTGWFVDSLAPCPVPGRS